MTATDKKPAMTAAAFDALVRERYSCRAFLGEPVPEGVIRQIFETAQRTASWCNAQSWKVDLVSGAKLGELSRALLADVTSGSPGGSDIPPPPEYQGEYLARRRAAGFALYASLGISREDRARRREQMLENYRFFGAPHVAIVSSPASLGPYGYIDCGGFVANVQNAAQSHGVATIAQAAVVLRPKAIRAVLPVPPDRHLVCAISMGYADPGHPANGFRTERATFDETVTLHT
ncbi:nitroreductase [Thermocatellispora tengchongensis]|uniref:Nitroreductase n=1 Tax=Thermocatellispora tengchongensis TaxID=1073253 RepID=A0A840PFW9_9ACTN|nr:nitroreductase [Thermocatellispora tengchongensis]MBB5136843.1 nitroreductase [Thermocatellispora tengchongensis]